MAIFRQKKAYLHQPLAYSVPQTLALSPFVVSLVALTLMHFWLSAYLAPSDDELYYWAWSRHLQGGYYDHPPMVAYLIRLSTAIFGSSVFAIRLPAVFLGTALMIVTRLLSRGEDLLTLVLFTPVFVFGACLMTPDAPFLFFWGAYLWWVSRINQTLENWDKDPVTRVYRKHPVPIHQWVLGGLILGLGGLSKYPMLLAVPCSFLVLATQTQIRGWLLGYAIHSLIALLVVLPVFVFSYHHSFAPFHFQWEHSFSTPRPFWAGIAEFIGAQTLIVGALPILMLPWILKSWNRLRQDPTMHACSIFYLIPFLFFLWRGSQSKLEANWALVAYLGLWPVAQYLIQRNSFRLFNKVLLTVAYAIPIVLSAALFVHLIRPLPWLTARKDRVGLQTENYRVAKIAAADIERVNATDSLPVYALNFQWTSQFRFQGIAAEQLTASSKPSEFTLKPADPCAERAVLAWETEGFPSESLRCFPRSELLGTYPIQVRGTRLEALTLKRYSR